MRLDSQPDPSLTLAEIVHPSPLTVDPNTSILQVIALMSQESSELWEGDAAPPRSCVVVIEERRVVGLWTERDVVRLIGAGEMSDTLRVSEVMTRSPVTLRVADYRDISTVLEQFQAHHIRHLPVVDDWERLVGLITQTRVLEKLRPPKTPIVNSPETATRAPISGNPTPLQQQLLQFKTQLQATNQRLQGEIGQRNIIRLIEEKLRSSEPNIRAFFEALTDIILIVNIRVNSIQVAPTHPGRSRRISEADTHQDPSKIISETLERFSPPDPDNPFTARVREALETGPVLNFEYSLAVGGETLWFSANITPLSEESVAWVARDITPYKQAEEALQNLTSELEQRVRERTRELQATNQILTRTLAEQKQADLELQKAHRQLRSHVDNSPLAVIEWDREFRVQYWSGRAEQMFGWTAREVVGRHWGDWPMVFEEDLEQVRIVAEALVSGRETYNICTNRNYTKDGDVLHCEWYNSVLCDESDRVVSILSLIQDVTGRQAAETELRDRVTQQDTVAHLSQQALADPDLDALFEETARSLASILKVKFAQIVELLPERNQFVMRAGVGWETETLSSTVAIAPDRTSLAGYTLLEGEPILVADLETDPRFTKETFLRRHGIASSISVPIPGKPKPFGVLSAHAGEAQAFDREDLNFLQAIANLIATAIERQQVQQVLKNLALGVSTRTSEAFFQSLVQSLAKTLQMECAFISEWVSEPDRMRTIALWADGAIAPNLEYELERTQCWEILVNHQGGSGTTPTVYSEGLREDFPLNSLMRQMRGSSFLGLPLTDSQNRLLGVVAVLGCRPASNLQFMEEILQIFAVRAASELERRQAEVELRESERQFRQLAESIREVFFICPVQGGEWTYISPAFESIWGISREEIYRNPDLWFESIHPEEREFIRELFKNHAIAEPFNQEYRIVRPDGTERWIWTRSFPVFDGAGLVDRTVGLAEDITDRRQVEDALRESEARYATLTDISPVGIFRTDARGECVYINEHGCDLLGLPAVDILGRGWIQAIHPEDRDGVIGEWMETLADYRPFQSEYRFRHPDGREVWVFARAVPDRDDFDEVVGFVGTLTDISERKAAEQSLQQLNQRLEMLVEQRTAQLQDMNKQLRGEIADRQKIQGQIAAKAYQQAIVAELGQKALSGIDLYTLIEEVVVQVSRCLNVDYCKLLEIRTPEPDRLTVAIAGQNLYSFILPNSSQTEPMSHDGGLSPREGGGGSTQIHRYPYLSGVSIPIDGRNSRYGILGVYANEERIFTQEDVHFLQSAANVLATAIERKQAESQLMDSLKEKEILLKEIHHRVKNNLLVVSNLLEFQSDYTDNPEVTRLLEDSQQRIQSMALIHEKLYQSTGLDRINFGDYLQDLADQLFDSYSMENHAVELELDIDPVELNLETANPCSLIVNELISNALKHAFADGRPGKLSLELHGDGHGSITLIVRDNGVGLPEGLDIRNVESLGMELIWTLTDQIEGTLELLEVREGTAFKLTFSELRYRQRY
ncbi:PAS domain S-box protein [Lyngbya sp. CCY1209]|uniref:PAS domain S-box protein n=1 Tax=Lyngbya sp. CCY1209 TaxID=2886103 RepID=UPI002D20CD06|nr:PAS domain S-box protein [Lyngbya sp. CCY1209]MEB3886101.1 PAS domain S-box protein [Lyngbya sp. CCY1209]